MEKQIFFSWTLQFCTIEISSPLRTGYIIFNTLLKALSDSTGCMPIKPAMSISLQKKNKEPTVQAIDGKVNLSEYPVLLSSEESPSAYLLKDAK